MFRAGGISAVERGLNRGSSLLFIKVIYMSCLGPGYNPRPPRAWYRVQNDCSYILPDPNVQTAYIPALKKACR